MQHGIQQALPLLFAVPEIRVWLHDGDDNRKFLPGRRCQNPRGIYLGPSHLQRRASGPEPLVPPQVLFLNSVFCCPTRRLLEPERVQ